MPGSFPGELAATRQDYQRWFRQIRDAGFNTIRVYTLHFPRFYQELKSFNEANPNHPILLFHGIWLEEEIDGYNEDLYTLTDIFEQEIRENIRAVHGDITISQRPGKAYGTYNTDISEWVIGYITGREIHPPEVLHTNSTHGAITSYEGEFLSIQETNASEAWLLARLDYLLSYEMEEFGTQRPVSVSSWPTLDPLDHPFEENTYETMASIDFKHVDFSNAKAGFFVSYHAYPYYPDYISRDPNYTHYHDHLGQNSYVGYLTNLKSHYDRFPLIIAEFGGSSSWGVAKYAHSGIHHGGYSERSQGEHNVRMIKNLSQAGTGGGIQFSWIDEWFKRTWITDPLDYDIERRIIWHNVVASEQNFGLIGYKAPELQWDRIATYGEDESIQSVDGSADFSYFRLRLNIQEHIGESDTLWVGIDTYDANLGESILPQNHQIQQNRAEFALMITNYHAALYVTQAYDTHGIWHDTSGSEQLYRSIATDGEPWRLVRMKNNPRDEEVQDIGHLNVNRLDMPQTSIDGVRLFNDHIKIRLPWHLLNVTDPSQKTVLHDNRNTPERETRTSDGFAFSIFYKDFEEETPRYDWENWNHALNATEYKKASYDVMQEALPSLPGNPIARILEYDVGTGGEHYIGPEEGVLKNDLSLDGSSMHAVLHHPTLNGLIQLESDGSFTYQAHEGYTGVDSFRYRVRAGYHWSDPVTVQLNVDGEVSGRGFVQLYPNPTRDDLTITSNSVIDHIDVYNIIGQRLLRQEVGSTTVHIDLQGLSTGVYFARVISGREAQIKKFMIVN